MLYDDINGKIPTPRYIPLAHQSKKPKVKWGGTEELPFTGKETSYGIDCGTSGLVVIDCDVKGDLDGVDSFITLCEQNGGVPETYSVNSPSGGLHFYFLAGEGKAIQTTAGTRLGPGIDIRANGGYIVGPGSTIKKEDGTLGTYEPDDESLPILPLPTWLREILSPTPTSAPSKSTVNDEKEGEKKQRTPGNNAPSNAKEEAEQRNALAWALTQVREASDGTRNQTLNNTAHFLGRKRVPEKDATQLIDEAMATGLTAREAQETFKSGYTSGLELDRLDLDSIVKQYNTLVGKSFKDDPLDTEFYSNVSLAYNFRLKYADELLRWAHSGSWYLYNDSNGTWEQVDDTVVKAKVQKFLENLITEIREKHPRLSISVYRAQERLFSRSAIESVTTVIEWNSINSNADLFDANPYLINCKNGVFDITTGKMLEHSRDLYMTKNTNMVADLTAENKYTNMVIDSIHPEEREYMQLIAGQALTGDQPIQQACFFLHGSGSNGKSTFLDLLLKTSGSYGTLQPPSVLTTDKGRENYALASFEGLRTAVVEELPNSKILDTSALKQISGTKQIKAREIYGKYRAFSNDSTIFVSCNRLPMVNETDDGTWRRLVIFTFPYSYKKRKEDVKGEWDREGTPKVIHAASRNSATATAFFAWRLKGAMRWYENNLLEYKVPEHITDTVMEWNENNDMMLAWFNECLEPKLNHYILFTELFDSYNEFLVSRGNSKVSMRYFSETLKKHRVFIDNKLIYVQRTTPGSHLTHSTAPGKVVPSEVGRSSFVSNVAFA